MSSCNKETEISSTETEAMDLNARIDAFIEQLKSEHQIQNRSQQEYTPEEAVLLIEGALNIRYTYPWHKHDELDVSSSDFNNPAGSNGRLTNRQLLDLYDDIEDFVACHNDGSTLNNKEPSVVDIHLDDSDPASIKIGVTSVVGALAAAPGSAPLQFSTSESYDPRQGDCDGNFPNFELPKTFTNNINHNLKPNLPVASTDPLAYNIINVSNLQLAPQNFQFGWGTENPNDILAGDNVKDYNTWWVRCSNNINSDLISCDEYILDGELTPLFDDILCLENTVGDDQELNYYQNNMQNSIASVPPSFNKSFVNCKIEWSSFLSTSGISRFHIADVIMGEKELINDPKELLTCGN